MSKLIESKINVGDIVQLISVTKAIDESMPSMVVCEIMKTKENNLKYKCVWFLRDRKWEFHYGIIPDFALKKNENINILSVFTSQSLPQKGQLLSMKTLEHEIIRDGKGKVVKVIPFCPPTMIFLEIVESKDKPPKAKCLYFNPISNKYSEVLLPFEVLLSLD